MTDMDADVRPETIAIPDHIAAGAYRYLLALDILRPDKRAHLKPLQDRLDWTYEGTSTELRPDDAREIVKAMDALASLLNSNNAIGAVAVVRNAIQEAINA